MRHRMLVLSVLMCVVSVAFPLSSSASEPTIEDGIVIRSFDDTPIVTTLMLPAGASKDSPVPVILKGHGNGGKRVRTVTGAPGAFVKRGYAVMTFDSRGFGESGGEANVDSPAFEVKDIGALISYLASRPEIETDSPGDPRVGFYGASYAAAIQLNSAAFDDRIDVIVPQQSWGDLVEDLAPNGVIKENWLVPLYGGGYRTLAVDGITSPAGPQTGTWAPEVHRAEAEASSTGKFSAATKEWFSEKSTTAYSSRIGIPTLLMQGTVDNLFPLQDAFDNYRNLKASGVPVKLVAYCEGHTACPYPGGSSGDPSGDSTSDHWWDIQMAWIDRYLNNDGSTTGPEFEWQAQDGLYYPADSFPLPGTQTATSEFATGLLTGPGGSGGDNKNGASPAPRPEYLSGKAMSADVLLPTGQRRAVVGVPRVRITGTHGGAPEGTVFFELIDRAPGGLRRTVDRQVTPYRFGPGPIDATFALAGVAWILEPGHSLEIEVTTGSAMFIRAGSSSYTTRLTVSSQIPVAPLT